MNTTHKIKALALGVLSLASATAFAQGPGAAPAVGTPAYDTWKSALVSSASQNASIITTSVNAAPTGTAPGCYFAPDGTYTDFPGNDDGSTGQISLPFTFCLYGSNYTHCYINNNGNVTFTTPTSQFSASGFPFSLPMVAPFWSDVYTYCGPTVKYKVEAHRMIVTWPGVGYYASCALANTFQCIITDGTDPGIGIGNTVAFYYGDMQWTTGVASGGSGGFGGTPATVGINQGGASGNYVQIGRFNLSGSSYDGGGGNYDGVDYLDYECFTFNTCASGNLPPSVSGAPAGNTITIPQGTTATLNMSFLPPEVAQQVSTLINTGGLCNTTINTNTSGAVSNTSVSISGAACNVGTHHIIYTATDNYSTPATTTVDITVIVTPNTNVPTISQWGLMILCLLSLTVGMIFIYKRENSFAKA